ncbi:MAG TPA: condensation domain-containing protein, partial [Thermoanaerobaculia bacterium]
MQEQAISGFRLAPQQEALWPLVRRAGNGAAYRAQAEVRLEGALDRDALSRALRRAVGRHEVLRTGFPLLPGLAAPLQVIADDAPPAVRTVDLSGRPEDERAAALAELFAAELAAPIDLGTPPLLRATVAVLSPSEHRLLLALPAFVADAAGLANLVAEIARAYAAETGEGAPEDDAVQYVDLA